MMVRSDNSCDPCIQKILQSQRSSRRIAYNQRASGNELRAAIDVGRKQYWPKQLKSLFSLDFKPKVLVVMLFLWEKEIPSILMYNLSV